MTRGGTRGDGPGLRLVVWLSLISGVVGGLYGAFGRGSISVGVLAGATNGAVLSFMEIFVLGRWARSALLTWPFTSYFALRCGFYAAVLLGLNTAIVSWASGLPLLKSLDVRDVEFGLTVCVAINLVFSVNELLGPGVLFAFAAGRYRRPQREERALLYVDLVGSTGLAERLGEARFLDFLNAFFADVTAEIVAEGGEIHKYVGDEVIAAWPAATDPERPIRACLAARRRLAARAEAYRAAFGAQAGFRAAIHAGPVVVGELGAQKKEIALIGDAMNTAARILEAARAEGAGALISAAYFERAKGPPIGFVAQRLAPVAVRGKSAPLALISLDETAPGLSAAGPTI